MSQGGMAVLILAVLIPLWIKLRKDFVGGLAYAVVILISFTGLVRVQTPGNLPELTIQRLIFLSLFAFWILKPDRGTIRGIPLFGWITAWAVFALFSLLGAVDLVAGLKRYLEAVFELFLFYFILATTVRGREDALRILRAACLGVSLVALMAIFEKYSGIYLVARFIAEDPEAGPRMVRATYRHRILLGTGMAMGWPLAIGIMMLARTSSGRRLAWLAAFAMLAACYFSKSRGPWLAAIVSGMVLGIFGPASVRKPLAIVGILTISVLLLMPGVRGSLFRSAADTLDSNSFKGGTFLYRLELWSVAMEGIKDSPWRLLFGNGPAAGLNQTIDWELSYRGKDYGIYSWDNDFAYALFQYGFLGLLATLVVYGSVAWRLLAAARRNSGIERGVYVCLSASALALFFMMSNVHIFARQLHYLFWTVTAVGFSLIAASVGNDRKGREKNQLSLASDDESAMDLPELRPTNHG